MGRRLCRIGLHRYKHEGWYQWDRLLDRVGISTCRHCKVERRIILDGMAPWWSLPRIEKRYPEMSEGES